MFSRFHPYHILLILSARCACVGAQSCPADLYQKCIDEHSQGKINFLCSDNGSGLQHQMMRTLAEKFNQLFPQMSINMHTVSFGEFVPTMEDDLQLGLNNYHAYYHNMGGQSGTHENDFEDMSSKLIEPADKESGIDMGWTEISKFFREHNAVYNRKAIVVPLDGDMFSLFYNSEAFDRFGKTPPDTIEEYAELAEFFQGKDLNGDGTPDYGSCFAVSGDAAPYHFLTFIVQLVQHKGTSQGAWFDIDTMKPTLNTAAGREALKLYNRTVWPNAGPPREHTHNYLGTLNLFLEGRCAMSISWSDPFWMSINSSVEGKAMTKLIPGSTKVWDSKEDRLVECTLERCPYAEQLLDGRLINRAPYNAFNGFSAAINAHATIAQKNTAFKFLSWISMDEQWEGGITIGWQPIKDKFYKKDYLTTLGFDNVSATNHGDASILAMNHSNAAIDLRILGGDEYIHHVRVRVAEYLDGCEVAGWTCDLSPQAKAAKLLEVLEEDWESTTEKYGRKAQQIQYRKMLNVYTDPWLDCAIGQSYDASLDACVDCPAGKRSTLKKQFCISCAPGAYSDQPGLDRCKQCAPGGHSNAEGSHSCVKCAVGKSARERGSSSCNECPKGKVAHQSGSSSCDKCPVGQFGAKDGSSACVRCSDVLPHSTTHGQGTRSVDDCVLCTAGSYSGGDHACTLCPIGSFSSEIGASSCESCPIGRSTALRGATVCTHEYFYWMCLAALAALSAVFVFAGCTVSRRRIRVIDISLTDDTLMITTMGHHRLLRPTSIPVHLSMTGHRALEGRFRIRIHGPRHLELLTEAGGRLPSADSSMGYLRVSFPWSFLYTGWVMPSAVWMCACATAACVMLALGTFAQGDAGLTVAIGMAVGAFVSLLWWQVKQVKTPLQQSCAEFLRQLKVSPRLEEGAEAVYVRASSGEHNLTAPGAARALPLAQYLKFWDFFRSFIADRSMYYLVANIVIPLTQDTQSSYAEMVGCSLVDFFVSHYWGHSFHGTTNALSKHAEGSFTQVTDCNSWRHVRYWICAFANNQWRIDEELGSSWEQSSFYLALHSLSCIGTVMVIDDKVEPLKRSWCLFELVNTFMLQDSRDTFVGLTLTSDAGVLNTGHAPIDLALNIAKAASWLKVENATASRASDKQMIDDFVRENLGFEAVNKSLRSELVQVVNAGRKRLEDDIANIVATLNSEAFEGDNFSTVMGL